MMRGRRKEITLQDVRSQDNENEKKNTLNAEIIWYVYVRRSLRNEICMNRFKQTLTILCAHIEEVYPMDRPVLILMRVRYKV